MRFLWALQKLGRRRRPRQKLARLSSWATFWRMFVRRMPQTPEAWEEDHVRAIVSLRKFDKHGDWHFFRDMFVLPFWLLVAPRKLGAHIQRYWYEDER